MPTTFRKLNDGWNADPNAPYEAVTVDGRDVQLEFRLNRFLFPGVERGDVGRLTFSGCTRYRLGPENDEGWHRGQCRFSQLAPAWGEFYEVDGDLLDDRVSDWVAIGPPDSARRHRFLFYLKDSMFEVDAEAWRFDGPASARGGPLPKAQGR
jgi:hypothetical protein